MGCRTWGSWRGGDQVSGCDCEQLLGRLYEFLDGELDDATCADVRAHLEACRPCISQVDFEEAFKKLVARSCREEPPAGLLERMRKALD